jgi:hypothetical protein
MLSVAVLGMALYGVYSAGLGAIDLFGLWGLDWWADLGLVALGLLLVLASAFVRVLIPGSLALALGALLGLQALSLHNDYHFYGDISVVGQIARGLLVAALVVMAALGTKSEVQRRMPGEGDAAGEKE